MFLFFHLPALAGTLLITCIALFTLAGIMIRPFKLDEARIALAGAGLLLITGLEYLSLFPGHDDALRAG